MMDSRELIRAAEAAIGQGQPDDYVIAPTKHAAELEQSAPALAGVLRRSDIGIAAGQYERKDREAGEAQAAFKRNATSANWAVLATACLSALLLVTGPLTGGALRSGLLVVLGACAVLSGALGYMWLSRVREGKMLESWMTKRASAEALRLKYFDLVTQAEGPPLLALEYFRRFQLEVQRAFYRKRGRDHKLAADKMLTLGSWAVAAGSAATGLAGLLGATVNPQWVAAAGLGAIAAALSAFASSREALSQDRRNEERYGRTLDALESLAGRLDEVRNAAAEGEREPLRQFVAAVHEQLSLEHRQWLGEKESTQASIARLEEALAASRSKLAKPERAGTTGT